LGEGKTPGEWSLRAGKLAGGKDGVFWFAPYFSGDFWLNAVFIHGAEPFAVTFGPGAVYGGVEFWMIDNAPRGQAQAHRHQGRDLTPRVDLKLEPARRFLSVRITGRDVTVFTDGQEKLRCRLDADVPPPRRCGLHTATGTVTLESLTFGSS